MMKQETAELVSVEINGDEQCVNIDYQFDDENPIETLDPVGIQYLDDDGEPGKIQIVKCETEEQKEFYLQLHNACLNDWVQNHDSDLIEIDKEY